MKDKNAHGYNRNSNKLASWSETHLGVCIRWETRGLMWPWSYSNSSLDAYLASYPAIITFHASIKIWHGVSFLFSKYVFEYSFLYKSVVQVPWQSTHGKSPFPSLRFVPSFASSWRQHQGKEEEGKKRFILVHIVTIRELSCYYIFFFLCSFLCISPLHSLSSRLGS